MRPRKRPTFPGRCQPEKSPDISRDELLDRYLRTPVGTIEAEDALSLALGMKVVNEGTE